VLLRYDFRSRSLRSHQPRILRSWNPILGRKTEKKVKSVSLPKPVLDTHRNLSDYYSTGEDATNNTHIPETFRRDIGIAPSLHSLLLQFYACKCENRPSQKTIKINSRSFIFLLPSHTFFLRCSQHKYNTSHIFRSSQSSQYRWDCLQELDCPPGVTALAPCCKLQRKGFFR